MTTPDSQAPGKNQQNSKNSEYNTEKYFKDGQKLLRNKNIREAMIAFKYALELNPTMPRYMSYYGLSWAMGSNSPKEALYLCQQAVKKTLVQPDLFCNLGKVYLLRGDRRKAYAAFQRGLALDKGNKPILLELKTMGNRKKPILPFLPRDNALNILTGKILTKLGLCK